jgi:hypothetical protein
MALYRSGYGSSRYRQHHVTREIVKLVAEPGRDPTFAHPANHLDRVILTLGIIPALTIL